MASGGVPSRNGSLLRECSGPIPEAGTMQYCRKHLIHSYMTQQEINSIRRAVQVYGSLQEAASHVLYASGLTDVNSGLCDRTALFADETITVAAKTLVKEIEALMDLNEQEATE